MLFIRKRAVFLCFLFLLFITTRSEAAKLSFIAEPSKIRIIIPSGGSQSGTIKVNSQADTNIKINVYLEDWLYTKIQDGTKDFFPAKTTPFSSAGWITFNPSEFTLPPYGTQNVNYVVRVPGDVKGGHFAVMFFETAFLKPPEDLGGSYPEEVRTGAVLNIRLGTLFYVETKDTTKRQVELSKFSVLKDKDSKYLTISTDIKNIGNTDIGAGGTFHIMDKEGIIYARGEFRNVYTLPGDLATLTAIWKEPLPKGIYSSVLTLDLGKYSEEAGRGPIIVKESEIEIGKNGEVLRVGELK